jgi:hypothetical protein
MNLAVVGIRSCLGERVREFFVRVHRPELEPAVYAHGRMRNVITICPANCSGAIIIGALSQLPSTHFSSPIVYFLSCFDSLAWSFLFGQIASQSNGRPFRVPPAVGPVFVDCASRLYRLVPRH